MLSYSFLVFDGLEYFLLSLIIILVELNEYWYKFMVDFEKNIYLFGIVIINLEFNFIFFLL